MISIHDARREVDPSTGCPTVDDCSYRTSRVMFSSKPPATRHAKSTTEILSDIAHLACNLGLTPLQSRNTFQLTPLQPSSISSKGGTLSIVGIWCDCGKHEAVSEFFPHCSRECQIRRIEDDYHAMLNRDRAYEQGQFFDCLAANNAPIRRFAHA